MRAILFLVARENLTAAKRDLEDVLNAAGASSMAVEL